MQVYLLKGKYVFVYVSTLESNPKINFHLRSTMIMNNLNLERSMNTIMKHM